MADQQQTEQVMEGIVQGVSDELVKLHQQAKEYKHSNLVEFGKRGLAIKAVMEKLAEDFGKTFMFYVLYKTNEKLGETLGPLTGDFVKKLADNGFKFRNVEVVAAYKLKSKS